MLEPISFVLCNVVFTVIVYKLKCSLLVRAVHRVRWKCSWKVQYNLSFLDHACDPGCRWVVLVLMAACRHPHLQLVGTKLPTKRLSYAAREKVTGT